ncbi:M23 family metallopeptidase [Streptomyces sp. HF10]|uniref:M23 family metallopeptidase n=1 Tax=Streptomyces sp. HF10 TaxID=2692233 RepID=UPI001318C657|nr:M23 family metallopeptidase [Streptomyces sp. HF10]QHC31607.1 peptidoglycan DD-metalloendopeptidase family protein [Streptomyces sp. HF10]
MRRRVGCGAGWAVLVTALTLVVYGTGVGPGFGGLAWAGSSPTGPPRAPAGAGVPTVARVWPVGVRPPVLRGWEPPATPYGPGHRGVDLAAAPGGPVRAVAAGRVSFAGRVAGRGVVTVELTGTGLRTTYEPVSPSVEEGAEVAAGDVVGVVATGAHCGAAACVHWGLLRGETYLNPLSLLPPWLLGRGPSRLLPVLTG